MSNNRNVNTFEDIIIEILNNNPDATLPFDVLKNAVQIDSKQEDQSLRTAINRLSDKNVIKKQRGGGIKLNQSRQGDVLEGVIDITRHGSGYVGVDEYEEDVRIARKNVGTALPDDRVRIKVFSSRGNKSGRIEGKVLEVLERGRTFYVGVLKKKGKDNYVIEADQNSANSDFFILPENLNGAKPNEKVIFKLNGWSHPKALPEAVITETLGKSGTNDANLLSILAENEIQASFPQEVTDFADKVAVNIPEEEYERRKDVRDKVVFTIDPEDAKDFDDGLSIEVLDNGNYYLGVHIADVTHYLQTDTVLDKEAYERGTSVYLVDRVVPMLPESLSNGVCSLRPKEDKLAFSCFMEIKPNGEVTDYSIDETVIHSNRRYTYEDVQAVLDDEEGADREYEYQIGLLEKLANTLLDKRFREGSIDFESSEPEFELDENGWPLNITLKERTFSHRIVEECMLTANRTVARYVDSLRKKDGKKNSSKDDYPFFYRIHDQPDIEKLTNIRENVKPIGIDFTLDQKRITAKTINNVLKQVEDTPLELSVNDLMLRAMAKAKYSPKNIGHFGLGFSHYAHFTSPIRRYPDVIVHRLLKSYASNMPGYQYNELEKMGEHLSEREQAAVDAERASIKLKQVEYLSERIGQEFDGVVSGVIESGIFVDLKDMHCEGMVRMSDLTGDYYVYDENQHCLVGRSTGKKYQLGDELRVKVARTDIEERNIDLVLA